jgi:hypothetical protein
MAAIMVAMPGFVNNSCQFISGAHPGGKHPAPQGA